MNHKFRGKYRNTSARKPHWNYAWQGAYFITICTEDRLHYFGKIFSGIMELSPIGEIVEQEWIITPNIRPDMNLTLREWVVMPNHFHAIIMIGRNSYNAWQNENVAGNGGDENINDSNIEMQHKPNPKADDLIYNYKNNFGPQSKNLASIVRGFKSSVTRQARQIIPSFSWQKGYHDHVIRDQKAYQRIQNYIISNPLNWGEDKFYK